MNLVERPTKLIGEGPGPLAIASVSVVLDPPEAEPELPPSELNAAQPEKSAAAINRSNMKILRISQSPAGLY